MMFKYVLFGIIPLSIFFSCDKSEDAVFENAKPMCLKQVFYDTLLMYEYTYTSTNLVNEEKSKLWYVKHHYNDMNRLIASDHYEDPALWSSSWEVVQAAQEREEWANPSITDKSFTTTYEYNNEGQMVKSSNYLGYSEYNYDKHNRIILQNFYHDNKISNLIEYGYDKKGNMIKRTHYSVSDNGDKYLWTINEYEFDNKHNPYQFFGSSYLPGRNTNPNNIIKERTKSYLTEQDNDKWYVTEYSYEYNEEGYPVCKNGMIRFIY